MTSFIHATTDWSTAGIWSQLMGPGPGWVWVAGLLVALAAATWSSPSLGGERSGKVREPILAGTWYEGSPAVLAEDIAGYLGGQDRPDVPVPEGAAEAKAWVLAGRHPVALIVPHAGHVYSGDCAGETFRLLQGSHLSRVILLGPSHHVAFRGAALPDEDAWRTPLGTIPLDREAIERLAKAPGFQILPRAHAQEHSLEIELPFLQKVLPSDFLLIPIVIGHLDEETLRPIGRAVRKLWDKHTVVVISSDFTHYGPNFSYIPFRDEVPERLRKLDLGAVERILAGNEAGFRSYRDSTGATICGAEPIRVLLEASQGQALTGRLVEYYRSGEKTGDFKNSVSYAGIAFFPPNPGEEHSGGRLGAASLPERKNNLAPADSDSVRAPRALNQEEQKLLLRLARETVQAVVNGRALPEDALSRYPKESPLREERGVFVTLTRKADGQLRGCIGSIVGERPLVSGVIENAVAAAVRDPRFSPVTREELPRLHLEISVLTPLRPIAGPDEIIIGRDGVLLEKGGRRAVFLPQVAPEQGWDVPEMLRHLSLKAGLGVNDWKSGARFLTFQAQVFEEDDEPSSGQEH